MRHIISTTSPTTDSASVQSIRTSRRNKRHHQAHVLYDAFEESRTKKITQTKAVKQTFGSNFAMKLFTWVNLGMASLLGMAPPLARAEVCPTGYSLHRSLHWRFKGEVQSTVPLHENRVLHFEQFIRSKLYHHYFIDACSRDPANMLAQSQVDTMYAHKPHQIIICGPVETIEWLDKGNDLFEMIVDVKKTHCVQDDSLHVKTIPTNPYNHSFSLNA